MTKARVTIRQITTADLDSIVSIHRAAFPDSALTKLGPDIVRRYYEWQLSGPHDCQAVSVCHDQEVIGFCFGGTFNGSLIGFLRKNRLLLVRAVLQNMALVSEPFFRARLIEGVSLLLRRIGKHRKSTASPVKQRSFGILSIAVRPQYQGSGAGRRLMEEAEAEAVRRGYSEMHLTVSPSNERAMRFYERQGWRKIPATPWEGRMVKCLQGQSVSVFEK